MDFNAKGDEGLEGRGEDGRDFFGWDWEGIGIGTRGEGGSGETPGATGMGGEGRR